MAKLTLVDVTSQYSANAINTAWRAIETAIEKQLSRDGTTPNTMEASLDMNGNKIINLGAPTADTDVATKAFVQQEVQGSQTVSTVLPSQTGNAGKFLQTNGSNLSWILALPDQTGQANKILTTDGTNASWVSETPVIATVPRAWVSGLRHRPNATNPTTDLDILAGEATDSTNTVVMKLTSTLIKETDNNWVAGNGGGRFPGSALGTGIHPIVMIRNPTTGVVDVGFDTVPGANLPAGFTQYRTIGHVYLAGAVVTAYDTIELGGGILKVVYDLWDNVYTAIPNTTAVVTVSIPQTPLNEEADLTFKQRDPTPTGQLTTAIYEEWQDTSPGTAEQSATLVTENGTGTVWDTKRLYVNTGPSSQIHFKMGTAIADVNMYIRNWGYKDSRLRDYH